MATRSIALWHQALVGRPAGILYTAPPGHVVLVKSIAVQSQRGAVLNAALILQSPPAGTFITIASWTLEALTFEWWQGWLVLEPGDTITLSYDAGPVHTAGFGALLPPRPPS